VRHKCTDAAGYRRKILGKTAYLSSMSVGGKCRTGECLRHGTYVGSTRVPSGAVTVTSLNRDAYNGEYITLTVI